MADEIQNRTGRAAAIRPEGYNYQANGRKLDSKIAGIKYWHAGEFPPDPSSELAAGSGAHFKGNGRRQTWPKASGITNRIHLTLYPMVSIVPASPNGHKDGILHRLNQRHESVQRPARAWDKHTPAVFCWLRRLL